MRSKLEQKIDKELENLGIHVWVYHIRAYGEGSQRRILGSFNSITIADVQHKLTSDIERDVGEAIENLIRERMMHGVDIHPATFVMKVLREFGYYGIAICDRRDNFSRKRGRIIAKGRLLKHLRVPELPDGTKW